MRYKGNFDAFETRRCVRHGWRGAHRCSEEEQVRDDRERDALDRQKAHIQAFIDKNIGGGSKAGVLLTDVADLRRAPAWPSRARSCLPR